MAVLRTPMYPTIGSNAVGVVYVSEFKERVVIKRHLSQPHRKKNRGERIQGWCTRFNRISCTYDSVAAPSGIPTSPSKSLERWDILTKQLKPKDANDRDHKTEVAQKRPFYRTIPALFCDALESAATRVFYGASKDKDLRYMEGSYAPVEEFGPQDALSVKGHLPEYLNGEFVRIGPNPKFEPVSRHHWFDGDGMLHGLRIKDGKVTYVSRFVRTSRLKQEEYWGSAKFWKLGNMIGRKGLFFLFLQGLRIMLGVLDESNGVGSANTALAYHNGKLLAISEEDKPYIIRVLEDGDLETVGRLDYDKELDHALTAHPKVDPVTGEMFTFGYELLSTVHVIYRVISKAGVMGDPVPITVSGPLMMHDFAITENYAIFFDCPLYLNMKDMVRKDQFFISFDDTKPIRFGVLPRYAKSEAQIRWFELPSCYISHNANAWEEGDEVVLVTCRSPTIELEYFGPDVKDTVEAYSANLWEFRLNLKTGAAVERKLGEYRSDFPRINEGFLGRKNRFVYMAIFQDATTLIIGVAKYDLTQEPELGRKEFKDVGGNLAGIFWHGSQRYGSEAVYVPKNAGRDGDEDDGYLLCYVIDENTGKSEMVVVDAKTMSSDPVAVIELPARVPTGLHAIFVPEVIK